MKQQIQEKHQKLLISLRYWLLGAAATDERYHLPLIALEYAQKFHTGVRKDGVTPEFTHQLTIAHYLRTLIGAVIHPAETIAVGLTHDVCEDFDVAFEEIERICNSRIANSTKLLTKVHRGVKISKDAYFNNMLEDPIASIVKGADRIHNLQSMIGVFSKEKQKEYISEAETDIIPMLKKARRNFPKQELAYENIKLVMLSQIQLIKASL
jgi:(p)ppGpp synthase/HD superfamily hydrolase